MTLPQNHEVPLNQPLNAHKLVFVRLLHLPDQVKKVVFLLQARTPHQYQLQRRLSQEIKNLYPTDLDTAVATTSAVSHIFLSQVAAFIPNIRRRMPRLGGPGPLGMRAEHWFDFGDQAGDADLFTEVVAHIACAAVPACSSTIPPLWTGYASRHAHWSSSCAPRGVFPSTSSPQSGHDSQKRDQLQHVLDPCSMKLVAQMAPTR